ncbi:MAG TPA: transposase [Candidatus Wunengus sp. YC61]|uniref:transposase n=1 Tax=Candidatus Wunengus sp. YC61 TaxID=3367698 RepID=UPI0040288524
MNKYGDILHSCWHEIPHHFPDVKHRPFVVMPNHVHGIIIISKRLPPSIPYVETRHAVSETNISQNTNEEFKKPVPNSLPTIIRSFKSAVTKRLNELGENLPATVWQRNYYEHVIRDKKELNQKIQYINSNPIKWEMDEANPINIKLSRTDR